MPYEVLLKKAHSLVDAMSEERLEYFVGFFEREEPSKRKPKKPLTSENIDAMLSVARPGDFAECPASIQRFRELAKNDVW